VAHGDARETCENHIWQRFPGFLGFMDFNSYEKARYTKSSSQDKIYHFFRKEIINAFKFF